MLNPVVIAADASAVLLAGSRLISAAKPFWSKLPRWLAVALPVVVAVIPQIVMQLAGVTKDIDFVNVTITAVALLAPGLAEAEATPAAPPVPAAPVAKS